MQKTLQERFHTTSGRARLVILAVILVLILGIAACGGQAPAPQIAPTPVPQSAQISYQPDKMYDESLSATTPIIQGAMDNKAFLTGLYRALFWTAIAILATFLFGDSGAALMGGIVLCIITLSWGYSSGYHRVSKNTKTFVDAKTHEIARVALGQYVEEAQKEQARNFQYIAAPVARYGVKKMICTTTVNYKDDCAAATSYYSTHDVNPHQGACDDWDDDGNCTHHRTEYDTEYDPWFPYLLKFWVSPDTKAKYLFSGIYEFECINPDSLNLETCTRDEKGQINDKRNPAVMLNADWRAPHGIGLDNYQANYNIPMLWQRVDQAKRAANQGQSSPTITTYWVGRYYNWGFASNSPWATVYDGPYQQLKSLTVLPGPSGQWFNYTDFQGRAVSMTTLLYSEDGDLPTLINPVYFIGFDNTDATQVAYMNQKAREFQGTFGPGKESIFYGVIVNTNVVQGMGGMDNTKRGIIGWLQDESVFGLFRLPKNAVVVIAEATEDRTQFTSQDMETALPFGNDLVKQNIRLSLIEPKPLTWESLMGTVSSSYIPTDTVDHTFVSWSEQINYTFSDMTTAGGIIELLYENNKSEYTGMFPQPDPNSDECTTAPVEHVGYIRHQMCTQQYLQTTIPISQDGRQFILNKVTADANGAVSNSSEGWKTLFSVLTILVSAAFRLRIFDPLAN